MISLQEMMKSGLDPALLEAIRSASNVGGLDADGNWVENRGEGMIMSPDGKYQVSATPTKTGTRYEGDNSVDTFGTEYALWDMENKGIGAPFYTFDKEGKFKGTRLGQKAISPLAGIATVVASAFGFGAIAGAAGSGAAAAGAAGGSAGAGAGGGWMAGVGGEAIAGAGMTGQGLAGAAGAGGAAGSAGGLFDIGIPGNVATDVGFNIAPSATIPLEGTAPYLYGSEPLYTTAFDWAAPATSVQGGAAGGGKGGGTGNAGGIASKLGLPKALDKLGEQLLMTGASSLVSDLLTPTPDLPTPASSLQEARTAETKTKAVFEMPDPLAQQRSRRRSLVEQLGRRGRKSTIMTSPGGKLGG